MNYKLITHLPYRILKARGSGYKHKPRDPKNFNVGVFGWGSYTPKHKIHLIPTLSIKDQYPINICQWCASCVAKEPDEGCVLDLRTFIKKAISLGLVSKDGFSSLPSGQKVLKEWGIVEEKLVPKSNNDWYSFINIDYNKYNENADKHKISSFWDVDYRKDILKLLDENRILVTAIKWFTGYNTGGGFRSPWIISKADGWYVGGHAFAKKGYILDYIKVEDKKIITGPGGRDVYVEQNSYGDRWGETVVHEGVEHKGLFFIDMDYFDKNNYGVMTNLDIHVDIGKFLRDYDGKNVKGTGSTVYFVQKGKIKAYPDEITYLAFNVRDSKILNWNSVEDEIIEKVEKGDNMQIEKSLYWDYLKGIEGNKARLSKLIQLLSRPD